MAPRLSEVVEMLRYVLSLALAAVTFGQVSPTHIGKHQINETVQEWHEQEPSVQRQTPQTDIAPHRVGETIAEWLKFNRLDLSEICQPHKRSDNRTDFKAVCKKLSAIRDTGRGEFYTTDHTGRTFGWQFMNGAVISCSIDGSVFIPEQNTRNLTEGELVTTTNNRKYTWKFVHGKLSEVSVTPDWEAIYKVYSEEGIARQN